MFIIWGMFHSDFFPHLCLSHLLHLEWDVCTQIYFLHPLPYCHPGDEDGHGAQDNDAVNLNINYLRLTFFWWRWLYSLYKLTSSPNLLTCKSKHPLGEVQFLLSWCHSLLWKLIVSTSLWTGYRSITYYIDTLCVAHVCLLFELCALCELLWWCPKDSERLLWHCCVG